MTTQEAVMNDAGVTLGAHAILIGWTADALEAEGIETEIVWGD